MAARALRAVANGDAPPRKGPTITFDAPPYGSAGGIVNVSHGTAKDGTKWVRIIAAIGTSCQVIDLPVRMEDQEYAKLIGEAIVSEAAEAENPIETAKSRLILPDS